MSGQAQSLEKYTYGDYLTWDEGDRWEIIEGRAYDMSPAPATAHQHVSAALTAQLFTHFSDKPCNVFAAPFDVRLPLSDEADEDIETVVQPDIVMVCDPHKLDERGCRGAPDWIIEILSPSTAAKDMITKKALFEKHGVREYWLVHPIDRIVTALLLGDSGTFGEAKVSEARHTQQVEIFPDIHIDWDRVFASLPGTLSIKEGKPPPYGRR